MSQKNDGAEVALAEQPHDGKFELTDKQPITEPLALVGRFEVMDRSRIRPSKTNPRKTFIQSFIEELAQNIGAHGLAMPPLIRPVPPDPDYPGTDHEVVAGEQRYRATGVLNWSKLPVYIRDLTDQQALEIQVIENLKRKDLHPLEEAEGFDKLMKEYGYTADTLAEKVKHSKSTIYASLKLLALCKDARKAFFDGRITQSTALLVARIPSSKLQVQAISEVGGDKDNDPMSARAASAHIQHAFMTKLTKAPFDIKDEKLLPKAGPCTTCPQRTGNSPELFHDVKDADVCTDTACFSAKRHAWAEIKITKAKDLGIEVISKPEQASKVFTGPGTWPTSAYAKSDEKCWEDPKRRTYAQIAKAGGIKPILVKHPKTGDAIELVRTSDIKEAMNELGIGKKSANATEKAAIAKAQLDTKIRVRALDAIIGKVAEVGPTLEDWQFVAFIVLSSLDSNMLKRWLKHAGWDTTFGDWNGRARMKEKIKELDAGALAMIMLQASLFSSTQAHHHYNKGLPEVLQEAIKRHGVDFPAIEAEVKRDDVSAKSSKKAKLQSNKPAAPAPVKSTQPPVSKVAHPSGTKAAKPSTQKASAPKKAATSTPKASAATKAAKSATAPATHPRLEYPTLEQRNDALREGWSADDKAINPYSKNDFRFDLWAAARAQKAKAAAGTVCPQLDSIEGTSYWPFKSAAQLEEAAKAKESK